MNQLVFATFAAVLSLLVSACLCVPVPAACENVRSSSMELNHLARNRSVQPQGPKGFKDFSTPLLWMEAKDMCDPGSLKHNPAPCMEKLSSALTSYKSALEVVDRFENCKKFVSQVKPKLDKLQVDMNNCGKSKGLNLQKESATVKEEPLAIPEWEKDLLCPYVFERLLSFSIITARVFAVGDPAHHADAPAQTCA